MKKIFAILFTLLISGWSSLVTANVKDDLQEDRGFTLTKESVLSIFPYESNTATCPAAINDSAVDLEENAIQATLTVNSQKKWTPEEAIYDIVGIPGLIVTFTAIPFITVIMAAIALRGVQMGRALARPAISSVVPYLTPFSPPSPSSGDIAPAA